MTTLCQRMSHTIYYLTHLCRPVRSTFAVRETASLGIMGEPRVPQLCRETQSLGQQMLNAPVGINGLITADKNAEKFFGKFRNSEDNFFYLIRQIGLKILFEERESDVVFFTST